MYEKLRTSFAKIVDKNGIRYSKVSINSKVLTKYEAIGAPEHDDYPLLKGRKSLVESNYCNSKGAAYSDMCGDYEGYIEDIVNMELTNNFIRPIFISTINAVLRHLNFIDKTEHCRNKGPVNCAQKLKSYILTSSSFINGTAEKFIVSNKKVVFYGVSGAGPTHLLRLNRYCEQ